MTTPVRGRSLTTTPRPVVQMAAPPVTPAPSTPTPPPPPIIPPTPKGPSGWKRFRRWVMGARGPHPWLWWSSVIAICLISLRVLFAAMGEWPVFKGYVICFGIFWFTCIGMLPITAIYRTGINVTKEIFDND
jgi:hypothetical protein